MYHFLRGRVVDFMPGRLILDVQGVGFELSIPQNEDPIGGNGTEVLLWTHLHFKDDGFQLFGFRQKSQRDMFRMLLKVTGIGPRLALQILSGLQPEELIRVLAVEDWKQLTLIPGIGPKTARRLLIELKEKLTDQELRSLPSEESPLDPVQKQAFTALTNLGFAPDVVRTTLQEIVRENDHPELEVLIKTGLKKLAP
jgi:Holliday junction DNA helicase RuvA